MTELRARRSRLARAAAHLGKAGEHAQVLDAGEHAHGCLLRGTDGTKQSELCFRFRVRLAAQEHADGARACAALAL